MTEYKRPTEIEAEKSVLGRCIIDPDAYIQIAHILTPDMFTDRHHRELFEAMVMVFEKSGKIDDVILLSHIDGNIELEDCLTSLMVGSSSSGYIKRHAEMIREASFKWDLGKTAMTLLDKSQSMDSSEDIINNLLGDIAKIQDCNSDELVEFIDVTKQSFDDILEERKNGKAKTPRSGIPLLDWKLGGFQAGTLTMVGARPSMGKTDFACNIAFNASKRFKVLFVSSEMVSKRIADRFWALSTDIDRTKLRDRDLSEDDINALGAQIAMNGREISFDFTSSPTAPFIRGRMASMVLRNGLDLVIIDHLHEMGWHTDHAGSANNWRATVKHLRDSARDFKIPMVLLTQLSRGSEKESRKPVLADLREAGEESADTVIMLHREGYQQDAIDVDELALIIRKNRYGALGEVPTIYNLTRGIIRGVENKEAGF